MGNVLFMFNSREQSRESEQKQKQKQSSQPKQVLGCCATN
jgi:hypothetical protein